MIEEYLKEKELKIKREKLLAWRDFYLQGQITFEDLTLSQKQKDEGIEDGIKVPIVNIYEAIRANRQLEKL